ncbi:MAG: HAMP domain-containing sensor histidine kinase [Ginsengibacter sp.]
MKLFKEDTFFKKNNYLLIIAAWLFTFSFIINNYLSGSSSGNAVQNEIQKDIHKKQNEVAAFFKDSAFLHKIANKKINGDELSELSEKDFYLFFYNEKDGPHNPVFWNTQIVEPDIKTIIDKRKTGFEKLLNGWYVTEKTVFYAEDSTLNEVVCLIPVKWDYYVENKYLHNSFVAVPNIEKLYNISLQKQPLVIRNNDGKPIFYLTKSGTHNIVHDNLMAIISKILGSLLILFFIYTWTNFLVKKSGFFTAFGVLVSSLFLIRLITYNTNIPFNFSQFELFNPTVYGSDFILRSLGDLLINSVFFVWIVLFTRFHLQYDYASIKWKKNWHKWALVIFISFLIIAFTLKGGDIVCSLVADSQISFDVINFFSLNIYSAIGFIVLSCVATGYFFGIQVLLRPINYFMDGKDYYKYYLIAFCGLVILSFEINTASVFFHIYILLWLLLFIYLIGFKYLLLDSYNLVSSRFIFWIIYFSISITAVIVYQNSVKELDQRKHFAANLAEKADPTGPVVMNIVLSDFRNEYLSSVFYQFKEKRSNHRLKDSLINEIFSGYNNKFDIRIYTFNEFGAALFNRDSITYNSLNTIIQTQSKPTGINDLYYYDVSYDQFNYISKKEIKNVDGYLLGTIFIISKPRKFGYDAVYPELFSRINNNSLESSTAYAFAVYDSNHLTTSYNDYPFPTYINHHNFISGSYRSIYRNDGYEELWYKAATERTIVIVRKSKLLVETITLFAYLFFSFLLVTIIFNIVSQFFADSNKRDDVKSFWSFSIRNQIHGTIILISFFSFVVIGITTILFFISRYHSSNQEKLSRTIQVMAKELRTSIDTIQNGFYADKRFNEISVDKMKTSVQNISNIHSTEMNLYDNKGKLIASSVPLPYSKGILSEKMDPTAFYHLDILHDAQFFCQQNIGSLDYSNNYLSIRSSAGLQLGYLNIPFFESQNNLKDEISNFLVTVINLNLFIFLLAGIIALFITNKITRSFSLISNKMKKVSLQTGNEEIIWNKKDEIGELVIEYNKMVRELENSAGRLAKSEREGAWREMAQQVAHEIKNPLTPMKLNLQYLQMAIDQNSPDVKKISLYVANILLEQIDHLAKIASDFAQFANITYSKNQIFNLNQTLENVIELYATNDKIVVNTHLQSSETYINADKTQVNRLFTNLLQNAVQAVPDDREVIINIKSEIIDSNVLITIRDNGNGIPDAKISKIFTPNFTTKSSGTGLGLAMCKGIVEKIDGKIWFETKENEWTIFYVEIPLSS